MEEENKRFTDWACSPEGIHYNLDTQLQFARNIEGIIVETISKLPVEVIDWITDNLNFISLELVCSGQFINRDELPKDKHIIVLNGNLIKKSIKFAIFIVAHEIAHGYLKHTQLEEIHLYDFNKFWGEFRRQEREANKQAIDWLGNEYIKEYKKMSKELTPSRMQQIMNEEKERKSRPTS